MTAAMTPVDHLGGAVRLAGVLHLELDGGGVGDHLDAAPRGHAPDEQQGRVDHLGLGPGRQPVQ